MMVSAIAVTIEVIDRLYIVRVFDGSGPNVVTEILAGAR